MSRRSSAPSGQEIITGRTTGPTIDLDRLRQTLTELHLDRAAEALTGMVAASVSEDLSPPAFLHRLLAVETGGREDSRIRTSLKLSGLPTGSTLSGFDFAFQPSVERSRIDALATCQWIRDRQSLLLLGPPGVGKTHLAVGLGVAAIERGLSVCYLRIEELLHALRQDDRAPPAHLKRRKYLNTALLIIDEVGFEPLTRDDANLFFRLVSHRYRKGSILITSNKGIRDWPGMLAGDETLAGAMLDRLLHDSHVLHIKGRSYRLRDLEALLSAQS